MARRMRRICCLSAFIAACGDGAAPGGADPVRLEAVASGAKEWRLSELPFQTDEPRFSLRPGPVVLRFSAAASVRADQACVHTDPAMDWHVGGGADRLVLQPRAAFRPGTLYRVALDGDCLGLRLQGPRQIGLWYERLRLEAVAVTELAWGEPRKKRLDLHFSTALDLRTLRARLSLQDDDGRTVPFRVHEAGDRRRVVLWTDPVRPGVKRLRLHLAPGVRPLGGGAPIPGAITRMVALGAKRAPTEVIEAQERPVRRGRSFYLRFSRPVGRTRLAQHLEVVADAGGAARRVLRQVEVEVQGAEVFVRTTEPCNDCELVLGRRFRDADDTPMAGAWRRRFPDAEQPRRWFWLSRTPDDPAGTAVVDVRGLSLLGVRLGAIAEHQLARFSAMLRALPTPAPQPGVAGHPSPSFAHLEQSGVASVLFDTKLQISELESAQSITLPFGDWLARAKRRAGAKLFVLELFDVERPWARTTRFFDASGLRVTVQHRDGRQVRVLVSGRTSLRPVRYAEVRVFGGRRRVSARTGADGAAHFDEDFGFPDVGFVQVRARDRHAYMFWAGPVRAKANRLSSGRAPFWVSAARARVGDWLQYWGKAPERPRGTTSKGDVLRVHLLGPTGKTLWRSAASPPDAELSYGQFQLAPSLYPGRHELAFFSGATLLARRALDVLSPVADEVKVGVTMRADPVAYGQPVTASVTTESSVKVALTAQCTLLPAPVSLEDPFGRPQRIRPSLPETRLPAVPLSATDGAVPARCPIEQAAVRGWPRRARIEVTARTEDGREATGQAQALVHVDPRALVVWTASTTQTSYVQVLGPTLGALPRQRVKVRVFGPETLERSGDRAPELSNFVVTTREGWSKVRLPRLGFGRYLIRFSLDEQVWDVFHPVLSKSDPELSKAPENFVWLPPRPDHLDEHAGALWVPRSGKLELMLDGPGTFWRSVQKAVPGRQTLRLPRMTATEGTRLRVILFPKDRRRSARVLTDVALPSSAQKAPVMVERRGDRVILRAQEDVSILGMSAHTHRVDAEGGALAHCPSQPEAEVWGGQLQRRCTPSWAEQSPRRAATADPVVWDRRPVRLKRAQTFEWMVPAGHPSAELLVWDDERLSVVKAPDDPVARASALPPLRLPAFLRPGDQVERRQRWPSGAAGQSPPAIALTHSDAISASVSASDALGYTLRIRSVAPAETASVSVSIEGGPTRRHRFLHLDASSDSDRFSGWVQAGAATATLAPGAYRVSILDEGTVVRAADWAAAAPWPGIKPRLAMAFTALTVDPLAADALADDLAYVLDRGVCGAVGALGGTFSYVRAMHLLAARASRDGRISSRDKALLGRLDAIARSGAWCAGDGDPSAANYAAIVLAKAGILKARTVRRRAQRFRSDLFSGRGGGPLSWAEALGWTTQAGLVREADELWTTGTQLGLWERLPDRVRDPNLKSAARASALWGLLSYAALRRDPSLSTAVESELVSVPLSFADRAMLRWEDAARRRTRSARIEVPPAVTRSGAVHLYGVASRSLSLSEPGRIAWQSGAPVGYAQTVSGAFVAAPGWRVGMRWAVDGRPWSPGASPIAAGAAVRIIVSWAAPTGEGALVAGGMSSLFRLERVRCVAPAQVAGVRIQDIGPENACGDRWVQNRGAFAWWPARPGERLVLEGHMDVGVSRWPPVRIFSEAELGAMARADPVSLRVPAR